MPESQTVLSRAAVREVDRRAIEEYGIPGIVLMENAGRNAAQIVLEHASGADSIGIVCGPGNNGGDGFVMARHLSNAGRDVQLFLAVDSARIKGDAAVNYLIVRRMGLPLHDFHTPESIAGSAPTLAGCRTIIDALLGTGFSGEVRPPLDAAIAAINAAAGATVFAVDVPSGLDCDSGRPEGATVRADHTLTFVAAKTGFRSPEAAALVGRVHVVDIGAPRALVEQIENRR